MPLKRHSYNFDCTYNEFGIRPVCPMRCWYFFKTFFLQDAKYTFPGTKFTNNASGSDKNVKNQPPGSTGNQTWSELDNNNNNGKGKTTNDTRS